MSQGLIKPQTHILKSGILVSQKSAARFKELMLVERQGYYWDHGITRRRCPIYVTLPRLTLTI